MGLSGSKYHRYLKRRDIRASVESGLDAANAVPNSGFIFVENSQGASAAASELSKSLDTAIEQVDLEGTVRSGLVLTALHCHEQTADYGNAPGDLGEQVRAQLKRLDEKAVEYSNSSLAGLSGQTEWTCSQSEAEVISIAWKCAAGAYDPTLDIRSDGFEFNLRNYVPSSMGGATKATTFILVDKAASQQASNSFLPVLVIAVRGTASSIDHMVNINSQAKDASCLYETEHLDQGYAKFVTSIEAHAGFLNSAQALEGVVSKYIDDNAKQGNVKHVLFTGHSAGGAVSSLLYLRYLLCGKNPSLGFSSITFGSPPALRWGLVQQEDLAAEGGLSLNIINEYDLVSRVDRSYIRTLVDLYRSIYDLPPIRDPDVQTTRAAPGAWISPNNDSKDEGKTRREQTGKYWIVPKPVYRHVGKRVVLKLGIIPTEDGNHESRDKPTSQLALSASCIPDEEFAKLLFCRVTVHSRVCYQERIAFISEGRFNGKNDWLLK